MTKNRLCARFVMILTDWWRYDRDRNLAPIPTVTLTDTSTFRTRSSPDMCASIRSNGTITSLWELAFLAVNTSVTLPTPHQFFCWHMRFWIVYFIIISSIWCHLPLIIIIVIIIITTVSAFNMSMSLILLGCCVLPVYGISHFEYFIICVQHQVSLSHTHTHLHIFWLSRKILELATSKFTARLPSIVFAFQPEMTS